MRKRASNLPPFGSPEHVDALVAFMRANGVSASLPARLERNVWELFWNNRYGASKDVSLQDETIEEEMKALAAAKETLDYVTTAPWDLFGDNPRAELLPRAKAILVELIDGIENEIATVAEHRKKIIRGSRRSRLHELIQHAADLWHKEGGRVGNHRAFVEYLDLLTLPIRREHNHTETRRYFAENIVRRAVTKWNERHEVKALRGRPKKLRGDDGKA